MPQLHEILAVEQSLAGTAKRLVTETTKKFSDKQSLFDGQIKVHAIFNEADQHLVQPTEMLAVQSTVDQQLDYLNQELANYWTVVLQKELANQTAKADIVIGGRVLAEGVPATALLAMEKKVESLLALYNAIPTVDAAKVWTKADDQPEGVFITKFPQERIQNRESSRFITVAEATPQHKAQVVEKKEETAIGKYTVSFLSGRLTSMDKAERIQRLTQLSRAIKQARQRANQAEVDTSVSFGADLLDFINKG